MIYEGRKASVMSEIGQKFTCDSTYVEPLPHCPFCGGMRISLQHYASYVHREFECGFACTGELTVNLPYTVQYSINALCRIYPNTVPDLHIQLMPMEYPWVKTDQVKPLRLRK